MKIVKKSNGKKALRMTRKEWVRIGRQLGAMGEDLNTVTTPKTDTVSTSVNTDLKSLVNKFRDLLAELEAAVNEKDVGNDNDALDDDALDDDALDDDALDDDALDDDALDNDALDDDAGSEDEDLLPPS